MILEKIKLIGKTVTYKWNGMEFQVTIKDIRPAFGRTDALISPSHGKGEKWVDLNSLNLNEK